MKKFCPICEEWRIEYIDPKGERTYLECGHEPPPHALLWGDSEVLGAVELMELLVEAGIAKRVSVDIDGWRYEIADKNLKIRLRRQPFGSYGWAVLEE